MERNHFFFQNQTANLTKENLIELRRNGSWSVSACRSGARYIQQAQERIWCVQPKENAFYRPRFASWLISPAILFFLFNLSLFLTTHPTATQPEVQKENMEDKDLFTKLVEMYNKETGQAIPAAEVAAVAADAAPEAPAEAALPVAETATDPAESADAEPAAEATAAVDAPQASDAAPAADDAAPAADDAPPAADDAASTPAEATAGEEGESAPDAPSAEAPSEPENAPAPAAEETPAGSE